MTADRMEASEVVSFSTARFGNLEIPADMIIDFPWGLVGFDRWKRFAVLESPNGAPLKWLQAVEESSFAVVVSEPEAFLDSYDMPTTDEVLQSLKLDRVEDGVCLLILVISKERQSITANLQGPILINPQKRLGRQLVLEVDGYSTKHPITPKAPGSTEKVKTLKEESC